MTYTNAGGISIDERPEETEIRIGAGHLGMDTARGDIRKSPV